MDLFQVIDALNHNALGWGAIVILLLSCIQISPIKINPWSWVAKKLGHALTFESCTMMASRMDQIDKLLDKITKNLSSVENRLETMDDKEEEYKAVRARDKILDFNDELLNGIKHSKESFDRMLDKIDLYEKYCRTQPDFKNNQSVLAIDNIKKVYKERLEKKDFL